VLIGIGTGLIAVISLAIQFPIAGSDTIASRVVVAMFAVLTIFWAVMWRCRPWPSRRISITFIVSADIGIAVVALQEANWLTGLFGFNAFALVSVYLLFVDGPKVLALHAVWILASTTAFALQIGIDAHFGVVAFAAKTLAAVAPMVATPLGIQFGIWTLRNDANEWVTDPLTGLLNPARQFRRLSSRSSEPGAVTDDEGHTRRYWQDGGHDALSWSAAPPRWR
jgi:hypothetical protein